MIRDGRAAWIADRRNTASAPFHRPLLGCECCVNDPNQRSSCCGFRAGMRRTRSDPHCDPRARRRRDRTSSAPVSAATVPPASPTAWSPRRQADLGGVAADGRLVCSSERRVRAGFPGQALPTVLTLANTCLGSERGLLGFTPIRVPHQPPRGTCTTPAPHRAPGGCVNRVSRFTMQGEIEPAARRCARRHLVGGWQPQTAAISTSGPTAISTSRWVTPGRDPRADGGINAARDLSLLNGKILRITLDGQPAPGNADGRRHGAVRAARQPSVDGRRRAVRSCSPGVCATPTDRVRPQQWRRRFFINDVGQSAREEVDEGGSAATTGWNQCEGFCPGGPPVESPIR